MTATRRPLFALTALAALIGFWLLAPRVSTDPQPPNAKTLAQASAPDFSNSVLASEIDRLIDEAESSRARWGVFIASMKDGRVRYAHDGDKLFTPASNMKIFTTAVALDLLGPDYRWRTSVYGDRQIDASGILDGHLTLYGRGAPDLDSKPQGDLTKLVDQLYQRGLRRVRGDIVGDESYFRAENYGVGWQWNDLQWYYGAEPSALTIDENTVEVTIAPANRAGDSATVSANPDDYVRLINNTTTGDRDVATSIGIQRGLSNNDVKVWGEFPSSGRSFSAFLSVHDPALRAATIFKRLLTARGIQVDGTLRSRNYRVAAVDRFDPHAALELAQVESAPLSDIVRETNKQSNNLFAELILRTIGKERGATVPDPDPQRSATRGDDAAGVAVVKKWLNDHGAEGQAVAIHDGSGLSRLDLVTPESAVRLLLAMAGSQSAKVFRDSLPIAGRDGTLRGRLAPLAGKVAAKTGYLTYTHALSGYLTTSDGEDLAFSIMCNDAVAGRRTGQIIDEIVLRLAQTRSENVRKRQK